MRDRELAEGGLLPPVQSPLEVCDSAPGPDFFALESPDDNAGVDADGACKVFNVCIGAKRWQFVGMFPRDQQIAGEFVCLLFAGIVSVKMAPFM